MPNRKTDKQGFATQDPDVERDIASRGGPALGPGIADNRHEVAGSYDSDLQTQIAAKGRKKKKQDNKEEGENHPGHPNNQH